MITVLNHPLTHTVPGNWRGSTPLGDVAVFYDRSQDWWIGRWWPRAGAGASLDTGPDGSAEAAARRLEVAIRAAEGASGKNELVLENDIDDGTLTLCRGEHQLIDWSMAHGSSLEDVSAAFSSAGIKLKIKLIS